jgi:hypothetical protein
MRAEPLPHIRSTLDLFNLPGESHEKSGYHRNNAHWDRSILRAPIVSTGVTCVSRIGYLGSGGHRGRPGWAARNTRERRGCGAQSYTTLRCRRYLLLAAQLRIARFWTVVGRRIVWPGDVLLSRRDGETSVRDEMHCANGYVCISYYLRQASRRGLSATIAARVPCRDTSV